MFWVEWDVFKKRSSIWVGFWRVGRSLKGGEERNNIILVVGIILWVKVEYESVC